MTHVCTSRLQPGDKRFTGGADVGYLAACQVTSFPVGATQCSDADIDWCVQGSASECAKTAHKFSLVDCTRPVMNRRGQQGVASPFYQAVPRVPVCVETFGGRVMNCDSASV